LDENDFTAVTNNLLH